MSDVPVNRILCGDALDVLKALPADCVDVIFADPPYNLQLNGELWRPNLTRVDAVDDAWDHFDNFAAYDTFTRQWLSGAWHILKPTGTIWVSGTYHNIFRVGAIMQDLGYWVLNTIIWHKPNAMPNFRGTRFKNDVEVVIWAKKGDRGAYTFRHHEMKVFNEGKQLGSLWSLPICTGAERLRDADGKKLHPTQKPELLLERIITASTRPGDLILDPFLGTGTTAAVAKRLGRDWIGIERETAYIEAAQKRIDSVEPLPDDDPRLSTEDKRPRRVAFKTLIAAGYLAVGEVLTLDAPQMNAVIQPDGHLATEWGDQGSIHGLASMLKDVPSVNGWKHWQYRASDGQMEVIDVLRRRYRDAQRNEG